MKATLLESSDKIGDSTLDAGINILKDKRLRFFSVSGRAVAELAANFSAANEADIARVQAGQIARQPLTKAVDEVRSLLLIDTDRPDDVMEVLKRAAKPLIDHPPMKEDGTGRRVLDVDKFKTELKKVLDDAEQAMVDVSKSSPSGRARFDASVRDAMFATLYGPDGKRNDKTVTDMPSIGEIRFQAAWATTKAFCPKQADVPKFEALVRTLIDACGEDPDLLDALVQQPRRFVVTGADKMRETDDAVARLKAYKAVIAEGLGAAGGNAIATRAAHKMLTQLAGFAFPPGVVAKSVEAAKKVDLSPFLRLGSDSDALDIHKAVMEVNKAVRYVLRESGLSNILDDQDSVEPYRRFIQSYILSRLPKQSLRGVAAALDTPVAARLCTFYGDYGLGVRKLPKNDLPAGVNVEIKSQFVALHGYIEELKTMAELALGRPHVTIDEAKGRAIKANDIYPGDLLDSIQKESMAFELFSTDPQINRSVERTANVKLVFNMSPELGAFRAAGGIERAISAGYHRSELSMLAKAFTLQQAATGCTAAEALDAVLDQQGKTRRLFSYGGRFTESVENFRAGLALMDKFAAWYANLAEDFENQNYDTVTKANAGNTFVPANAVRAYEMFVFQDMAINPSVDLNEQDPEKLFGIEHNDATNFFTRGNGSGCTGTLVKLSPAKRQVVYAAFKALEPPIQETGKKRHVSVSSNEQVLARVLRHYDEVVALKDAGQLDRAHLNKVLTPDLDLPPDASPLQVTNAIQDMYFGQYGHSPSKLMEIGDLLCSTGCTVTEVMNAMQGGEKPAPLADIASTTMKLEQIDGTSKGGRDFMLADLHRPNNPGYIENKQPVLAPENNHFTVNIEGRTIRCAVSENTADNAHVADQIEALCGTVHVEQANTVMRGLSQAAHGPLLAILPQHGIANPIGSEHTPLTYTLSKNDETGAVTIRYSEPDGFPFKFHWETNVALDGTSSTTPIAIEA